MRWFTNLFRRADFDGAASAIDDAIQAKTPPDIAWIADQCALSKSSVQSLFETAASNLVMRRVTDGIHAGRVTSQEIYELVLELGLPAERAKELLEEAVSVHFTKLVLDVLEDGQVDPAEDKRLSDFMSIIGQSTLGADTAAAIERGKMLYRAYHGPLQPVDAPVLLKRGEYCVYVVTAEAIEERSRTVRINYHGPTARIRIMKGVYYRLGSIQPSRQTEEYQHSFGTGALCFTNKRLLWISPSKSISVNLSNIVRFDAYSDGLRIFKGSGKPLLFVWEDDDPIATAIAQRTIEELR